VFEYDRRYAERVDNMCSTRAVGILEIATLETLGTVCGFYPLPGGTIACPQYLSRVQEGGRHKMD
jgi:hypothetical protein